MESLSKQADFANQYRFMDDAEATAIFQTLVDNSHFSEQQEQSAAQSNYLFGKLMYFIWFISNVCLRWFCESS